MISITAKVKPDQRRIDKLVEDLQYISRQSFVQSLPFAPFRQQALSFLKKHFPVSKSGPTDNAFGKHLVEGWMSDLVNAVNGVGFKLYHVAESDHRVRTILQSLDAGSRPFSYTVKSDFTFWGKYASAKGNLTGKQGWMTMVEGRTISRGARQGIDYSGDTYEYIKDVLLPQMREMVQTRVKNRLERIS